MRRRIPLLLKDKAISSMRHTVRAFNEPADDGRQTTVMLHLQHASEMLLKAALREKNVQVFDHATGRSIGFEKCIRLSVEHLGLDDRQAGILRALDALRDEEMHWFASLNEGLLYLHARAGVTLFDEVLFAAFNERLAAHLPERVLPISTRPVVDLDVLVDEQYNQVRDLLAPRKRRRPEARALLRGLLALEGHVSDDARVSDRDVDRVEAAVRDGKPVADVFPRLGDVRASFEGEGTAIRVHFTKSDGAPVHFVPADDPGDSAAVREIDLQRRFPHSASDLAEKLNLTNPRALALRKHLGIDDDVKCHHEFVFASQRLHRFSDNALRKMQEARGIVDMDAVWQAHKPVRRRG